MGVDLVAHEYIPKELRNLPENTDEKIFRDNGITGDLYYGFVSKQWKSSYSTRISSLYRSHLLDEKNRQMTFDIDYNIKVEWYDITGFIHMGSCYESFINEVDRIQIQTKGCIDDNEWKDIVELSSWVKNVLSKTKNIVFDISR